MARHQPLVPGTVQLSPFWLREMTGGPLSSFTVTGGLLPVLPPPSVAVQVTWLVPSVLTLRGAVAAGVSSPTIVPSLPSLQVRAAIVSGSPCALKASTVNATGGTVYQPLGPGDAAADTETVGEPMSWVKVMITLPTSGLTPLLNC